MGAETSKPVYEVGALMIDGVDNVYHDDKNDPGNCENDQKQLGYRYTNAYAFE
jgi:hypothetical protein